MWDKDSKTCSKVTGTGEGVQTIENFMEQASQFENEKSFCSMVKHENKLSSTSDISSNVFANSKYTWDYGINQAVDGAPHAPSFERWNSMCFYTFTLPDTYKGGLGIEVKSMPKDVSTFLKVGDSEYFNDDKITAMSLGISKTIIQFDM